MSTQIERDENGKFQQEIFRRELFQSQTGQKNILMEGKCSKLGQFVFRAASPRPRAPAR
jgi:hypothetical protein